MVADGVPPSEIAVLFRVNAQSETYEQALTEAGIPYQVRGGERFFHRPEVRRAMSAASAWRAAGPGRRRRLVDDVRAVLAPRRPHRRIRPAARRSAAQWESLLALVELAEELVGRRAGGRPAAASSPSSTTRADAAHPPTVQGVTLASLHAAKGLEWDAVFLVGLVDGTLPIQHADGDEHAIEEERRLLYVGITRARRQVLLSWALARAAGRARGGVGAAASSTGWCPSTTRRRASPSANAAGPSRAAGCAARR